MPTLLQFDTCLGSGSTGRIAEIIGDLARDAGWQTYMAHGSRFVKKTSMTAIQVGNKMHEYKHYAISRLFDCHGLGSSSPTRDIIKKIDEIKPDVIQIHNIHGYYVNYKMLLQYLAAKDIPTVITMHDFWLMTGHCAYINESCTKWETGCGNCKRLKEYPSAFLDRTKKNWELKKELFKGFNKDKLVFVPVSYWLESFAKRSLLYNSNFKVIQNGVDVKVFYPYNGEHSELWKKIDWSKQTIVAVADRWTESNGFNDLITLSQILPDDMQIVIVGLNANQMLSLPGKIIGIGHTDNVQQLIEIYTSADVLFNSSKEVTFGLVTAEAMACGTPAIVFNNTAGEEIIDENTGFAIDDISKIPALVRKCRENSGLYHMNCRKRIVEEFDSISQYSKYIELYKNLLI